MRPLTFFASRVLIVIALCGCAGALAQGNPSSKARSASIACACIKRWVGSFDAAPAATLSGTSPLAYVRYRDKLFDWYEQR